MSASFVKTFQSEWLKKKKSLASWLVIIGAFFVPFIYIISRLIYHENTVRDFSSKNFWNIYWIHRSWEMMALFLLPVGIILVVGLITQIENKNNAWKQLHTLPISYTTIYFSKLSIIITMMVQFFIIYNIGVYLTVLVPYMIINNCQYPPSPFPFKELLIQNLKYFIDCLPIIALQFLLSFRLKNFVAPMGIGFLIWISSFIALRWKHGIYIPYSYTMYNYTNPDNHKSYLNYDFSIHTFAIIYTIIFILFGYYIYIKNLDKS